MAKLFSFVGNLLAGVTALGLLARYVPPQVFWPPTIVALLLPGLLLLTLLFAGIQVYRRRWRSALLPLLVLGFALPTLGYLFAWPTGKVRPLATDARLAVTTANLRVFRGEDSHSVDTARIGRALRRYAADVLLLQEVGNGWKKHRINEFFGSFGPYPAVHQPDDRNLATLGRAVRPVAAVFSELNEVNGYLVSDVETPLGTIRFINAHLQSNRISAMAGELRRDSTFERRLDRFGAMLSGYGRTSSLRAQQAEEIRKLISASPHPVIVGGDFNDVPSSYTYQRILTPRLRDAWATRGTGLGTTFTGPLPGLRIDFLFVDTSLHILTVERLDEDWSDHRPLRAEIAR